MNHMRRPDRSGKKETSKSPPPAKKPPTSKSAKQAQKKPLKGVQK